jgi:hypothetical protein
MNFLCAHPNGKALQDWQLHHGVYDSLLLERGDSKKFGHFQRLTENPKVKVLVLEAGTDQTNNPAISTAFVFLFS